MIDLSSRFIASGIINKVIHNFGALAATLATRTHGTGIRYGRRRHGTWAATVLALAAGVASAAQDTAETAPQNVDRKEAAAYLEFEEVLDGKCYILSSGGKLVLMHNRHPERAIAYRLVRVFAGHPQGSLTVGRLDAGVEPIKLGCSEVDGRPQHWRVVRAEFEPVAAPNQAPHAEDVGANDTTRNADAPTKTP